jgi:hypothetical protein
MRNDRLQAFAGFGRRLDEKTEFFCFCKDQAELMQGSHISTNHTVPTSGWQARTSFERGGKSWDGITN